MKTSIVKLSSLSENDNLRLCYTLAKPQTKHSLVKLINCLELYEAGSRPKGGIVYLEDENCALSLGGEQINVDGSVDLSKMPLIPFSYYESSTKGKVLTGDILICKDGALTGKSCFVSNAFPIKEVMVNEHVYILRGNGRINQKILFYIIRSPFVQLQIKDLAYRKKGQPGLNTDHLTKIKIPDLDSNLQNKVLKSIESIEVSINKLKGKKDKFEQIIDRTFSKEFGLDLNHFENLNFQQKFRVNF